MSNSRIIDLGSGSISDSSLLFIGDPSAGALTQTSYHAAKDYFTNGITGSGGSNAITEVQVSGTTTLDSSSFGKLVVLSGTSADYTVYLPNAIGQLGQQIGFIGSTGLSRFVTLDPSGSQLINGAISMSLWTGESAILESDNSNWRRISGINRQIAGTIRLTATQNGIADSTSTKVAFNSADYDNTGRVADIVNGKILIPRTSVYNVNIHGNMGSMSATATRVIFILYKNGASYLGGENSAVIGSYTNVSYQTQLPLGAGEYLELYVFQNSGATQTLYGQPFPTASCTLGITEIIH